MRALQAVSFIATFCTVSLSAAEWPISSAIDAQPLIAQALRVSRALDTLGQPLPPATRLALQALKESQGDKATTAAIEQLLDAHCLAAIEVGPTGITRVVSSPKPLPLAEQGWRMCLLKVINRAGSTGTLRTDSPNAKPVPKGPQSAVAERWLDLQPFSGQPLLPNLSGLGLEYTILQVYSRDAGKKSAEISFFIDNGRGGKPAARAGTQFDFVAAPSHPVTFKVAEFDGSPATAAFQIRDSEGRIYPSQSKRLAPDFFFHPQVYRATGETVLLPSGTYTVVCSRGPESIPETKKLLVDGGPAEVRYTVARWIDPSKRGWWSGDHHIHAAGCLHYDKPTEGVEPIDMMRHILGEDLKVGCCLTWGPCFDYQKRFFTGKPDNVSKPPYLLRYDVEVSGFGSHASGHLNLLNLKEQIPAGGGSKDHWPTLGMNTLRWAKKQGAICGPAHSGNGLTRFVGRVDGATDGPNGLPNFKIPAYDGIGANEFIVQAVCAVPGPNGTLVPAVDFISAMDTDRVAEWTMWYHVLNCGTRVRASGETDFPCISGDRVGMGRVYVKVDGALDFDRWVQGIADGRSYVSDGTTHLMDCTATAGKTTLALGMKGSEIRLAGSGNVGISLTAASKQTGKATFPVELIVNGLPVASRDVPCDGLEELVTFEHEFKTSGWVAIRSGLSAHTNPFFVIVGDKPIRASKHSAQWCLAGVEQCWKMKEKTYRKDELKQAMEDYATARATYSKVLEECSR